MYFTIIIKTIIIIITDTISKEVDTYKSINLAISSKATEAIVHLTLVGNIIDRSWPYKSGLFVA